MAAEKFAIEASHIMMFARAVGDDNPIYHDEDYAKGQETGNTVSPPPFLPASASSE